MDSELIRWLVVAIVVPAGIGLWALLTKVIIPYYQKEATVTAANAREKDRSLQVFGETQAGRAQDRSNDIQDKLVAFLLASNDGKIYEILNTSKDGTAQIISLILKTDSGQAEQARLIIASQNQLITLLSRFLDNLPELSQVADYGLSLQVAGTSIESAAVQQAKGIATAATAPNESDLTEGEKIARAKAGEGQPVKVIAIVKAEEPKGE